MSSTSASRKRKRCTLAALLDVTFEDSFLSFFGAKPWLVHLLGLHFAIGQHLFTLHGIRSYIPLTWTLGAGRDRSLCIRKHPFKVLKRCISLSAIQQILWHQNHFVESTTVGAIYLHVCIQEDAFVVNSRCSEGYLKAYFNV